MKPDAVRRSLLALAERRLGVSFPARFSERWISGADVAGGAPPSAWMRVDEMAWPGGEGPREGVGFPEDGSADFQCLLAEQGRLSEVVHAWSHESRTFEPVEPWLGARAEGASWSEGELWEKSPVSRGSREAGSSVGARPRERATASADALILAVRIEDGALRGRADWATLRAPFNEATGASMSLQEFRARGESDPASLVERLLLSRPPAVDPRALSRDEIVALVARAHEHGLDLERAGAALVARSELPSAIAEQLATGAGQLPSGWPSADHIVDFALSYRTPRSASEVWALAHAWAAETARGESTVLAAFGTELLLAALGRIDVPELDALLHARTDAKRRELRERLGLAVAPAPAEVGRPPEGVAVEPKGPRRVRHPKFGEGVVVACDGTGPDAKLTIAFASGEKRLKASFVQILDPGEG